ncbi:MAG TPA: YcaO-like family protein, partial [Candidatus Nitrosocosmicus sp.]|nr:YcaO-like family protein [Candidatus Nitrosocosmicus sp.]
VYGGKGPTRNHAKASAIMESIERFSSLPRNYADKIIRGSYEELSKSHNILKYSDVIEPVSFSLDDKMMMDYCVGYDLMSQKNILVPLSLALFKYIPKPPAVNPYAFYHTNGLASGNVIEEAICHSLCEVIERDAVSIAEFVSSAFQFHILRTIENELIRNGVKLKPIESRKFVDDNEIYPDVDLKDIGGENEPTGRLLEKFKNCQISIKVKDVTSDLEIPTFIASSVEWINHDYGYLVEGHGTHPDSRIAMIRAITEVSQSRAANIQGSRDDLRKMKYDPEDSDDKRSWQFIKSAKNIKFSEVTSYHNEDILDDIKLILAKLKERKLNRAIIVNLTHPRINIPVVRAIVPGLETFKVNKSIVGNRAKESFVTCLNQ